MINGTKGDLSNCNKTVKNLTFFETLSSEFKRTLRFDMFLVQEGHTSYFKAKSVLH